jgi:hypothetical protein
MKPPKTFMNTFFVIIGIFVIAIFIEHHGRKKILDSNHKQIMLLTEQIEELKKDFQNDASEAVTKADMEALAQINYYQSEKDKRYLDNKFELSKGYATGLPDFVFLILILWLSFQLDNISRKIHPSGIQQ